MATASTSATSQWDFRNRDLVPPSRLPRPRQASPLSRDISSSERPRSMITDSLPSQSSSVRPSLATTINHSRSTSFFSFLKSNDNTPSTAPSRRIEPTSQHSTQQDDFGRLTPDKRSPPLPSSSRNDTLDRSPSTQTSVPPQQLHPEIRSVVSLTHVHAHKIYMSGPLIRRIERMPDGHQPIKDEDWRDVWAQLGGTTLSIWDMKEIEDASKQGKEVPPTYINVTDAVSIFPNV
jgi:CCR4-NOT transcriptional complex subunit CAF120